MTGAILQRDEPNTLAHTNNQNTALAVLTLIQSTPTLEKPRSWGRCMHLAASASHTIPARAALGPASATVDTGGGLLPGAKTHNPLPPRIPRGHLLLLVLAWL